MRTETKTTNHFILDLTEEEAVWLRNVMQNPLFTRYPDDEEDPKDKEMRYKFFSAVEKAGRIA